MPLCDKDLMGNVCVFLNDVHTHIEWNPSWGDYDYPSSIMHE